jgi:hypothetical protein
LIRLKRRLGAKHLKQINSSFKDILSGGTFRILKNADEDDDQDPSLERLIFKFNRSSYNRLRELIDFANSCV